MSDNSKRFTSLALSTVLLIGFLATNQSGIDSSSKATKPDVKSSSSPKASVETKKGRAAYFFNMLRDPATNRMPEGIRQRELAFARTLAQRPILSKALGPADGIAFDWKAAGPNDVGGRTRALAIDHTNSNTIIAGGISGGIWKSTDGGQVWTLKTAMDVPLGVTWISQDPRSGQNSTWYYTSGEFSGNSASDQGSVASFYGTGVYKSTDNGETWSKLASTRDINPLSFSDSFDFVSKIIIHPASGNLYVATNGMGIFRSTDGGTSFSRVLGAFGQNYWADIAVSSNGTLLVTLSERSSTDYGVYRSTDDGDNWTDITPNDFPSSHGRSVIGMAPSNPDAAYILTYDYTGSGSKYGVYLFKVTSIADSTFSNRTDNIPDFGDPVGKMNTQGNYNMVVSVRPDDEDFVLIGGTNLYRSTDGFSTTTSNKDQVWIGGYASVNNISQYQNQHPDQHVALFDPNDAGVLWTGHDGGISKAADVTAAPMVWESMNNAYNVTQFYHVSIAADSGNTNIVGGTQDNGSPKFDWNAPNDGSYDLSSGDGAYSYLGSQFLYTSSQEGYVYRFTTDGNFQTELKPNGTSGQLFIHPFTVDPSDESIMYYPLANVLMRNNTVDTAVSGNGWTTLSNIAGPAGTNISTLAASTSNPEHRLYFAASGNGIPSIYKLDNADSATDGAVDISIPGLDAGSYVHNIAVNPNSADEILVVMSNYNIVGLYHSNDGGANYTAVEGNLEGADDGPSLRWGAILPMDATAQYIVGTSIGLFSTATLNGSSTIWTQEGADVIGNVIVAALAARTSDNTVAAATHGRGIFIGEGSQTGSSPILNTVAQIEFGDVLVGSSVTASAKIKNTGTADLSVSTVAVTGVDTASFVATPLSLSVPAGDSAYVKITFTPTSVGTKTASLQLAHNASGSPSSIPLTGFGLGPVTLSLGTAWGAPGDTLSIPVTMANPNTGHPVAGVQFDVVTAQPGWRTFLDTVNVPAGFSVSTNNIGDILRVVMYSENASKLEPAADTGLMTLRYVLTQGSPLGSTNVLSMADIEVADTLGVEFPDTFFGGRLQAGIRGDVNLDSAVSIMDIILNVRLIIGKDAMPDSGITAHKIADANGDTYVNIGDVIQQVNMILGIPTVTKPVASTSGPIAISLGDARIGPNGRQLMPVVIEGAGMISGLQVTFTYDPATVVIGGPVQAGDGIIWQHHAADGVYRLVGYSMAPGTGLRVSSAPAFWLPVTVTGEDGGSVTLTEVIMAGSAANIIPVTLGTTTAAVNRSVALPTAFSLSTATPNPFNPSTTIAYEVPEQTHVTLTIYNLLGQEVVRLMDQVQAAGRYEAVWNGTNLTGAGVASGIYLYRIVSGSGYTETKRMTLLK